MNSYKGLQVLGIIHKAMLAGQLVFALVCFYLISSTICLPGMIEFDKIFQVIGLVLSAAGYFAGTSIFKRKIIQARDMPATADKFALYRTACIIQWAFIEGPCIFNIIAFFLTGNYAFLALAAVLMVLFAMLAPSKGKALLQLGLTEQELQDL